MDILTFRDNGVKYPIALYGKLGYLSSLISKNHNKLIDYVSKGNWIAPNQNPLVQFMVNMKIDISWDDEYIYAYIMSEYKKIASLLKFTSLYNQGEDHPGSLFSEKNHHTLYVVPFGPSQYTSEYYFQKCSIKDLYPFRTLFTTDTTQHWDINGLTDNTVVKENPSVYTVVQIDPFALMIGYVRYCRHRIKENILVGITPQSYLMRYPIANFYYQHNLMVAMNYCLEGIEGYSMDVGKWAVIDYTRWIKEYSLYIHNSMFSFNPKTVNQYIDQNKTLGINGVINDSVYPFMGMSGSFDRIAVVYTFNSMHIAIQYAKYCNFSGKPDSTFLNKVKNFLRNNVGTLSRQIADPLWRKLFVDMFNQLKQEINY